jgi:hypothetical protein
LIFNTFIRLHDATNDDLKKVALFIFFAQPVHISSVSHSQFDKLMKMKMVPTDMAALLLAPKKLCRIFVFGVLFLTLLAQICFVGVITYSRKYLWDITAAVTHQHYDQEYNFPKLDTYSRACSKTPPVEKRYSEWTSCPTQEACTPSTASEYITRYYNGFYANWKPHILRLHLL